MFFFGKFGVFCCFLVISVLRFALLTDELLCLIALYDDFD